MSTLEIWEDITGYTALCFSFMLFLSILPEMIEVTRSGYLGERSIMPYLTLWLNGALWVVYGVLASDYVVLLTNGTGTVCGVLYTSIYLAHLTPKHHRPWVYGMVTFGAAMVILVALVAWTSWLGQSVSYRETWVGYLCCFFNIALYASPLSLIVQVIDSQSTEGMSFPLSVTILCGTIMWTAYACLIVDYNILIPSVVGVVSAVVQLSLFYFYGLDKQTEQLWDYYTKGPTMETLPLLTPQEQQAKGLGRPPSAMILLLRPPSVPLVSPKVPHLRAGHDDRRIAQFSGSAM